jgi:hypothetical protein
MHQRALKALAKEFGFGIMNVKKTNMLRVRLDARIRKGWKRTEMFGGGY